MLNLNRVIFASFVFAFKTSLVAALIFGVFAGFALYLGGGIAPHDILSILFILSGFVFMLGVPCCVIAFLISIFKKTVGLKDPRWDYAWVALAALLANGVVVFSAKAFLFPINLLIYTSSIFTLYIGTRFYRSTWTKLAMLQAQGSKATES